VAPEHIVVVTSHGLSEPRAPRHALAAKLAFPSAKVTLVYYPSVVENDTAVTTTLSTNGILTLPVGYPTLKANPVRFGLLRASSATSRILFQACGAVREDFFHHRFRNLSQTLLSISGDVYFSHNFETLLPAARAAEINGATLMFDCMEYYSDMGDGQSVVTTRAIQLVEKKYLPSCAMITAASPELASIYGSFDGVRRPLVAYNCPSIVDELPTRRHKGLRLYWRNSVLGLGQRGLDDALLALSRLPRDITLCIQGHLPRERGEELRLRMRELKVEDRVEVLPPYPVGQAVLSAAVHDVGLCLERLGPRNHELTVSNKMFDYHMAGLAVISSDMPSLSNLLSRSGGGLTYRAGYPNSLAAKIIELWRDPQLLKRLQISAREYAIATGNHERTIEIVAKEMKEVYSIR